MNKELFERFINNECTEDEILRIVEWFKDEADSNSTSELFKSIWNKEAPGDSSQSTDYEKILERIHQGINLPGSNSVKPGSRNQPVRKKYPSRIISVVSKIAAILFIPLLIFNLYTCFIDNSFLPIAEKDRSEPLFIDVTSPMGSTTFLELPDGSNVWLNHGSHLQFPQKFTGRTRTVRLSGEGYFQITADEQKPFVVESGQIQAFVTGTEFNMMAYPEDEVCETTLESGKLVLQKRIDQNTVKNLFEMVPGHHIVYFRNENKLSYNFGNTAKYSSWKEGKLIFHDDSFDDIIKKLNRWYNVDIQLDDEELYEYTFTGTLTDENIFQVLELLEIAIPIRYTVSDREKQQDGTFSKRKIIIQLQS